MSQLSSWVVRLLSIVEGLTIAAQSTIAVAQSDDNARTKAVRLYQQALAAYQAGRMEAARDLFDQAFRLRQSANIAYNLGLAELQTGHPVEAARHLAFAVRLTPKITEEEHAILREAERKVGQLVVGVNVDGAEISIDQEKIGQSPLPFQPVYVQPGKHVIHADKAGFIGVTVAANAIAGQQVEVKLILDNRPAPVASETSSPAPAMRALDNIAHGTPSVTAAPTNGAPNEMDRPRSGLPARTIVLVGEGALAATATAVGIASLVTASSRKSDAEARASQLRSDFGPGACSPANSPTQLCAELSDSVHSWHRARDTGIVSLAVASALGIGTVATFVLWPSEPKRTAIQLLPEIGPHSAGLSFAGRF